MKALWKQESSLHPAFERVHRCLADDWFLLPYELRLQGVHALALEAVGVLDTAERKGIELALAGLDELWRDKPAPDHEAEDLHTWVESELTERAGDAGTKIHTARSRNDQVATLTKMWLIDRAEIWQKAMTDLSDRAAQLAMTWAPHTMPLMTHLQFAAPGSAGAWPLAQALAFERYQKRLDSLLDGWKEYCPLGAGAIAGSSIPLDRTIQAQGLGFRLPHPSSIDATGSRDDVLEALAWVSQVSLRFCGLATDLLTYGQTPYGWIRFDAGLSTGSSMMPNKANPDAAELLRGEAARLTAAQTEALFLLKGLPSGYNRDLQCLKPLLHDTVTRFETSLALCGAILEGITAVPERMSAALHEGDVEATLRMESRVLDGASLRDAHHAEAGGTGTPGSFGAHDYATEGSASPEEVCRQAAALQKRLNNV